MKKLDARLARDLLEGSHLAWCHGDIERMLSHFVDDLSYWCNAGMDGAPYEFEGKPAMRTFLRTILAVADSSSIVESFSFADGVARAKVASFVKHKRTGYSISGSYRQVVTYRGRKIWRIEEFHDAARMAAFWRFVTSEDPPEFHPPDEPDDPLPNTD